MVSKFIKREIKENVWEHENIGEILGGKKETSTTPGRPSVCGHWRYVVPFFLFAFFALKLHIVCH